MILDNQLEKAISRCLIQDQFWLTQQAKKLKEPNQNFVDRFEKSLKAVEQKQNNVPDITYNEDLPVSGRKDEIIELIKNNQVVIIAGETGSGKTTQLPKMCLEAGLGIKGRIGHTQPRRIAAHNVALRLCEEMGVEFGQQVGSQVRFSDKTDEHTLVKLMTDGILLSEFQYDRFLNQYDCLIIDEAHERSLNIDFILGFLKRVLAKRKDLKVIITSATIDVQRFSEHFNRAPIVEVSGRSFPVDIDYCDHFDGNVSDQILSAVEYVLEKEKQGQTHQRGGSFLVFLPGEREIREASEILRKSQIKGMDILPLYARLSTGEQQKIFKPNGSRRIVLATNVAETSLTVPGIHYVIDSGLARMSRYSIRSKVQQLPIEDISQASANQRSGRCGRIAPGLCIRLYDEASFLQRDEFTEPEILRTNLAAVILQTHHLRLGDIEEFDFLQAPDHKLISDGYRLLFELGAVTKSRKVTKIGQMLSKLPIDPRLARVLIQAQQNNCLREVSIIVAGLSIQDPREFPQEKKEASKQAHMLDADNDSDFISFVNLWNRFETQRQELSQNNLRKYCKKHFLHYLRMREWRDIHHQLVSSFKSLNWKMNENNSNYDTIHQSLLTGYLSQCAMFYEKNQFMAARNRQCLIHPSTLTKKRNHKWIMSGQLLETNQLYARLVAKIDPKWIEPLAQHLINTQYSEPHWSKKQSQVVASAKMTLFGLIIVANRKVQYNRIDAKISREIFIRQGLVEQQFESNSKLIKHNINQIEQVEGLEAKARKRDILVDDQWLFDFYDQHIPEDINNGISFHKWLKDAANEQLITLTPEILTAQSEHGITDFDYPDHLQFNQMTLPLAYAFSPGQQNDGITITVPSAVLTQLNRQALEWMVPGLVKEKCIALIKSLPKNLRKLFVPVPNFVDDFLKSNPDKSQSLTSQMSEKIRYKTAVMIDPDQWQAEKLEQHHRFIINVVDEKGKTLEKGNDLDELIAKFKHHVTNQSKVAVSKQTKTENLPFAFPNKPVIPEISVKHAGISIKRYQSLVVEKGQLQIQNFGDQYHAINQHQQSVLQLLKHDTISMHKSILNALKNWKQTTLYFAPFGQAKELNDDLIMASIARAANMDKDDIPYNASSYQDVLLKVRNHLDEQAQALAKQLNDILKLHHSINKTLKGKMSFALAFVFSDVKTQISHLVYPNFIQQTPIDHFEQLSRYLKACEMRLARHSGITSKEQYWVEQLNNYWKQFQTLQEQLVEQQRVLPQLETFRWMLEEYRISLFAQTIKTQYPISQKRMDRCWEEILQQNSL
ncbi:ATP-dependent RNA helicase HrpA [Marinicellulosiphila megalodicopiae]|uniref:ATP-dependent RNA helicase HrpA n=1 Tax=Marinicellulosiphila megalodicopiae TaxID=2724896 RepID=UPI003BB1E630